MNEWTKYDGTNPPTDKSKHVLWECESVTRDLYTTCSTCSRWDSRGVPVNAKRYMLIEPYTPPVEYRCPVCGGEMGGWYDGEKYKHYSCESETHKITVQAADVQKLCGTPNAEDTPLKTDIYHSPPIGPEDDMPEDMEIWRTGKNYYCAPPHTVVWDTTRYIKDRREDKR